MALCPECKIDIGNADRCPLCGYSVNPQTKKDFADKGLFKNAAKFKAGDKARRMVALETLVVSCMIAAVAILATDLINDMRLSWSPYPLLSLSLLLSMLIPVLLWPKNPLLYSGTALISVLAYLLAMDAVDGSLEWALQLGIPISFIAFLMIGITVALCLKAKRRGLNVLAYVFFAAAGFCLGLESILTLYRQEPFRLYWSAITASALIPVALFLLYAHYRLTKNSTLRKIFHL